ncbi:MAG: DUF480 domain-containing protein [Acidobacteria bacterium]|nr:MAG: DUF480 domain-containing protein [Acidobacteriota bacterium]REK11339.1 MAG: DUF480 domain-containing protein [Acidobacteriota bacterium]
MAHTRRLDPIEERICGALMEKEQATPDGYPLTLNSLVLACNQKSNRDPVLELTEAQVKEALERLRRDVLVWRVTGGRVAKWEHRLQSRWHLDAPGLAVMTLLMLRGAQTPGELRSRSERLHSFADVAQVEDTLRALAEGDDPLVQELPRQPGQRENRWRHLMVRSDETPAGGPSIGRSAGPPVGTPDASGSADESSEDAVAPDGDDRTGELERRVAELERRLGRLESQLGVD